MKTLNLSRVVSIVSMIASAAALSACGTNNQKYADSNYTAIGGQTSNTSGMTYAQQCSAMPNIRGAGYNNTVDREFRACKGTKVGAPASHIAIFPEDQQQKQLCVFPVQIINNQVSVIIANQYAAPSARYVAQCATVTGTGASMNFGSLQFQGAYLVNYTDAANFASCLATGTLASCAANYNVGYSFGTLN